MAMIEVYALTIIISCILILILHARVDKKYSRRCSARSMHYDVVARATNWLHSNKLLLNYY